MTGQNMTAGNRQPCGRGSNTAAPARLNMCLAGKIASMTTARAVPPQRRSYDELPAGDEVVELDLRLGALGRTFVPHDLPVRVTTAVELDVGFGVPFRIGDELVRHPAAQELLRDAALLPDHERCAFRLPDSQGVVHLGRVDLDVDEPDYRHGGLLRLPGQRFGGHLVWRAVGISRLPNSPAA